MSCSILRRSLKRMINGFTSCKGCAQTACATKLPLFAERQALRIDKAQVKYHTPTHAMGSHEGTGACTTVVPLWLACMLIRSLKVHVSLSSGARAT